MTKFNVGDRIRYRSGNPFEGELGTVITPFGRWPSESATTTRPDRHASRLDDTWTYPNSDLELAPAELKVGDRVIVGRESGYSFWGKEGTIISIIDEFASVDVPGTGYVPGWNVRLVDLTIAPTGPNENEMVDVDDAFEDGNTVEFAVLALDVDDSWHVGCKRIRKSADSNVLRGVFKDSRGRNWITIRANVTETTMDCACCSGDRVISYGSTEVTLGELEEFVSQVRIIK
jgi:hypothetical protein